MNDLASAIALHRAGALDPARGAHDIALAHQSGEPAAALELIDRAFSLIPGIAQLYGRRCAALCGLGRLEEALAAIDEAERLGLDAAHCRITRADILCDLHRYEEGAALYEQALSRDRKLIRPRLHLGMARLRQGDLSAAEAAFRQALTDQPRLAEAHHGLGLVHRARNDLIAANQAQKAATAIDPNLAPAQLELGELDLLAGFFREGFAGYEWRYHLPHAVGLLPKFKAPAWDGTDLQGQFLFVYVEQGYGDSIMFARFLPQAAARGARVILGVSPPLARLFAGLSGVERIATNWSEAEPYQRHAPISSLAWMLGVDKPEAIPTAPYLRADLDAVARFRTRIGPTPTLNVGVVWSGRSDNPNDAKRSLPAAKLRALAETGVHLFSLHKDARPPKELPCVDLGSELQDFADAAAAIEALDLVISVDTAIAHLAGALGKPVWILLPFAPDWRWRLDRPDSDWYPSARLFRQPSPGDWDSVVNAVADQLASLTQRA